MISICIYNINYNACIYKVPDNNKGLNNFNELEQYVGWEMYWNKKLSSKISNLWSYLQKHYFLLFACVMKTRRCSFVKQDQST